MSTKTKIRKLRPPIKRHGGKAYLARLIVPLMPEHSAYCEPFLGGGSVLLNKPKAGREIAGDLDADLVNLWQHLECVFFRTIVRTTPYREDIFEIAKRSLDIPGDEPQNRAINYIVRNRFSRGGLGKTFACSDRLRGGKPGDENAWDTIRAELPAIAERVRSVEFHCRPAMELIEQVWCDPKALIYADPPYLHETRTATKAYGEFEMSPDEHRVMLNKLSICDCAFLLSGYRSPMYDAVAAGNQWHRIDFDMPNHSGQGKTKQRRTECVWSNRPFKTGAAS